MRLCALLALFAGALLPLAFAPWGYFPLAILSPAVLLFLWRKASPKQALVYGLVFGIGLYGVGASWIYISIHYYGNTNIFFATIITSLFVLILASLLAGAGYFFARLFPKPHLSKDLIAFPCIWVFAEWIRSWIFSGFPWLLLGQSQTNSPLHGYAPVLGVYGVSFIAALSAAMLIIFLKYPKRWLSLILLLAIWIGGWAFSKVQWTVPVGTALKVSLIQGNIPQSIKWSDQQALNSLQLYFTLTQQHWQSDLIIWPESAVTILYSNALGFLENLHDLALSHRSTVLTGVPFANSTADKYYNGAIVLGDGQGHYFKRHLVPFGEYVPFENIIRGLIGFFNLPMSSFSPGPVTQPLVQVKNLAVGVFICYEIAYPALLRSDLPGANLLVTISDDTWFGGSAALAQHRQIAQFAAQVSGRYMLVATNSGDTVIINPQGKITNSTPRDVISVLNGTAQGMKGITPWITFGDMPVLILLLLMLILAWLRQIDFEN